MPATAAKPATPTTEPPLAVDKPKHPLPELTTYELREYRRQLEKAIAFFDQQHPVPPARTALQTRLTAVIAEQDERAKIARG